MASDGVGKFRTKKSRLSKPYERQKSLFRKVSDTVTGLLSQPAWLISWLKIDNEEEKTEDTHHGKEALNAATDFQENFIFSRPSVSFYPRVQLPLPRDSSTQNISLAGYHQRTEKGIPEEGQNGIEVREQVPAGSPSSSVSFLDENIPGPSALGHSQLVTANPDITLDGQYIPSKTTKNTQTDGDDHSDESESTSGCSSLVPHPDKREYQKEILQLSEPALRKLGETTLGMRGKKTGDIPVKGSKVRKKDEAEEGKDSESSSIKANRSLFSDDGSSTSSQPQMPALSSKRPKFSITTFGSPVWGENSVLNDSIFNSPFYQGKTTYGGASAYRSRGTPYQASPRRQVKVKPVNDTANISVMSNTAKRILNTLERMSTPVLDAKKIPLPKEDRQSVVDSSLSFTPVQRRPNLSSRSTLKHGNNFGPPTRRLSSPVPVSIARNHECLVSSNLPKRAVPSSIVRTAGSPEVEHSVTMHRTLEEPTNQASKKASERSGGKIKTKLAHEGRRVRATPEDETVEQLYLPSVPLPITSLPTFSFGNSASSISLATSSVSTGTNVNSSRGSPIFTFSSPILKEKPESMVTSVSLGTQFVFSSPLTVSEDGSTRKSNPSLKVPVETSNTGINFNFKPPEKSAFVPKLKSSTSEKRDIKEEEVIAPSPASELKSESVLCALQKTSNTSMSSPTSVFKTTAKQKSSSERDVKEEENRNQKERDASAEIDVKSTADSYKKSFPSGQSNSSQFGDKFKAAVGSWDCNTCMIRNKAGSMKCIACETPKPVTTSASGSSLQTAVLSSFGDKFRPPSGSWECSACMIRNKTDVVKCIACETARTSIAASSVSEQTQKTSGFGSTFRPTSGSWECDTCLVRNKNEASKCVACESPKPGAKVSPSKMPFKFASGPSQFDSIPKSDTTSGFKFGVNSSSQQIGFKFGTTDTDGSKDGIKVDSENGFKIDNLSKPAEASGHFMFGVNKTDEKASILDSNQPETENNSGFVFSQNTNSAKSGFVFGASKAAEEKGFSDVGIKPSAELKTGSVMDILGGKKTAPVVGQTETQVGFKLPLGSSIASASTENKGGKARAGQSGFSFVFDSSSKPAEKRGESESASSNTTGFKFTFGKDSGQFVSSSAAVSFGMKTSDDKVEQKAESGTSSVSTMSAEKHSTSPAKQKQEQSESSAAKKLAFGLPATTGFPGFNFGSVVTTASSSASSGTPSVLASAKSSGFTFGASSTTVTESGLLHGSQPAPTTSSVMSFGLASDTMPVTSTVSFGTTTSTNTTASTIFKFGVSSDTKEGHGFGSAPPSNTSGTPAATSGTSAGFGAQTSGLNFSPFGASQPSTTAGMSRFTFGSTKPTTASTTSTSLSFGVSQPSVTTASSVFSFGTAQPTTTTTFNFLSSQPPTTTSAAFSFGTIPTQPASTTSATFSFGATQSKNAELSFNTAVTSPPAFGSSTAQQFGTAGTASGFGTSGTSSFGASGNPGFGTQAVTNTATFGNASGSSTPASGFTFSTNPNLNFVGPGNQQTSGVFTFGGNQQQQQQQQQPPAPSSNQSVSGSQSLGFGQSTAAAPAGGFSFNPNTPPSFNFSGGIPPQFSATPTSGNPFDATTTSGTGSTQARRIRKAVRRHR